MTATTSRPTTRGPPAHAPVMWALTGPPLMEASVAQLGFGMAGTDTLITSPTPNSRPCSRTCTATPIALLVTRTAPCLTFDPDGRTPDTYATA